MKPIMNPLSVRRFAAAAIAVMAIALAGVVVAPASVAHADPTAWTCAVDTFVWRTGGPAPVAGGLNQAPVTAGIPAPTSGPALTSTLLLAEWDKVNAMARHPKTGIVYAYNVGSLINKGARVINPDGTVEDVSANVPLTTVPPTAPAVKSYAGGTFNSDGYWLLADASGNFIVADLRVPGSLTYGTVVNQGVISDTLIGPVSRWLSGDMAYRASDDSVYFTTWTVNPPRAASIQVGSIPWSKFLTDTSIVPTFGPTVSVAGVTENSGAASGFDSAGNLWMSTNVTVPVAPTAQQVIFRLDAAALTGVAPISVTNVVFLDKGSPTDGFMCRAPAAAGADPTLPATGPASDTMPIVGGGVIALLMGVAFMIFAGARRQRRA